MELAQDLGILLKAQKKIVNWPFCWDCTHHTDSSLKIDLPCSSSFTEINVYSTDRCIQRIDVFNGAVALASAFLISSNHLSEMLFFLYNQWCQDGVMDCCLIVAISSTFFCWFIQSSVLFFQLHSLRMTCGLFDSSQTFLQFSHTQKVLQRS